MLLEPAPDWPESGTLPASMATTWRYVWIASKLIGSIVTVPLAEELAFRGYLLRRLIAADFQAVSPQHFTWMSFLFSSVAFGLLHGRWLAGTLAGMAFALTVYRRGRLGEAVLAHAVTNALIAATVLGTGAWYLWS
jgi:CAAX prenyl protease-like protein